jgi:hypothetical protein
VYPLLRKLAEGHTYADLLAISDEVDEIIDFITSTEPVTANEAD